MQTDASGSSSSDSPTTPTLSDKTTNDGSRTTGSSSSSSSSSSSNPSVTTPALRLKLRNDNVSAPKGATLFNRRSEANDKQNITSSANSKSNVDLFQLPPTMVGAKAQTPNKPAADSNSEGSRVIKIGNTTKTITLSTTTPLVDSPYFSSLPKPKLSSSPMIIIKKPTLSSPTTPAIRIQSPSPKSIQNSVPKSSPTPASPSLSKQSTTPPTPPLASPGKYITNASMFKNHRKIVVSKSQDGNHVLSQIHNVQYEIVDNIEADYVLGAKTCVIFISIRFHLLRPDYLTFRLSKFSLLNNWPLRVVLCLVDNEEQGAIRDISKIAIDHEWTLIMAWSNFEAARWLETYKMFENVTTQTIQERVDDNYKARAVDCLTNIKSVNSSDASMLLVNFKTIRNVAMATVGELTLCPGLGAKKGKRIYEVFHQSLNPLKNAADKLKRPKIDQLLSSSSSASASPNLNRSVVGTTNPTPISSSTSSSSSNTTSNNDSS